MMRSRACRLKGFLVLNSLVSWLFKLVLLAMAMVFFASLMVVLLLSLLLSLVRWLLTGRPPQVKVVMQRYKDWQSRNPLQRRRTVQADVVDAEVREVPRNHLEDKR